MTCREAIVTMPDFSYTGEIDPMFGWENLVVETLFLPKSEHFSVKVFALEALKDEWNVSLCNIVLIESNQKFWIWLSVRVFFLNQTLFFFF